ncbi:hypothetical protein BDV06DRAFT_227295 [Aspergillus oleicola]
MRLGFADLFFGILTFSGDAAQASDCHVNPSTNLTMAMVRAPPPDWPLPIYKPDWTGVMPNLNSSIGRGIKYMHEAKENGANWILFPELWFPGFPKGAPFNNWTTTHLPTYIANSMVIGSPEWTRLTSGVKSASICTAITFAERQGDNLYMSQALISPLGDLLMLRHKLRPSAFERDIFSDRTIVQAIRAMIGINGGKAARLSLARADVDFDEVPMLYYSLDTGAAGFDAPGAKGRTYDVDGQASWGVLRQIVDGFPGYIPREEGNLVPRRNVSVDFLLKGGLAYPDGYDAGGGLGSV